MSIPEAKQRKLFARSGNRCAFCRRLLTADGGPPDRLVVLDEMAHIVADWPQGPRGASPVLLEERNRAEKLILLCNHHQRNCSVGALCPQLWSEGFWGVWQEPEQHFA